MSDLDPDFVEWARMHRPRQPEGPATFWVRILLMKNLWDKDPGVRASFHEWKALRESFYGDLEERRNADGAFTFEWPDHRKCEICGAIVRPRWERP